MPVAALQCHKESVRAYHTAKCLDSINLHLM